jgi:hypothetical protein
MRMARPGPRAMGSVSQPPHHRRDRNAGRVRVPAGFDAHRESVLGLIWMGFASLNDLNMPPAWNTCMDIGGKYAGTVAGSIT